MKGRFLRFLAIFLVLCLSFSFIACDSCNEEEQQEQESGIYNYDSGIDKNSTPLNIVEGGTSSYKIVIPQKTDVEVETVASELIDYVIQVSGVKMDIVTDNVAFTGNYISLGNTKQLKSAELDGAGVKDDGYVIKTVDGNVYVYGSQGIGVQNGVYTFMERFMGIRWLSDKETYVPKSEVISVYECDIKEEPIFTFRNWYSSASRFSEDFFKHVKFNEGGESWYSPVDSKHNISDYDDRHGIGYLNKYDVVDANGTYLPNTAKSDGNYYLKEIHPEYFTNEAGERKSDEEGDTTVMPKPAKAQQGYDVCYTNGIRADGSIAEGDNAVNYIISKIKRVLENDKDEHKFKYFHIGQMDSRGAICQCHICQKRINEIRYSGVLVMFINAIEKEVNTWLEETQSRTVIFSTFAYHESENPPVNKNADGTYTAINELCNVSENVWIRVAPIDADYSYSFKDERQTEFYQQIFGGWQAVADNFIVWDYNICFIDYYYYYPNLVYLKENYEYYAEIGVRQLFHESCAVKQMAHYQDLLRIFIVSKLQWNLNWSVEDLKDEFLTLYYGEAFETADKFIDTFENFYAQLRNEQSIDIKVAQVKTAYRKPEFYGIGLLTGQMDLIDSGLDKIAANTELSAARKHDLTLKLKQLKLTPMVMLYENYSAYYHPNGKDAFKAECVALIDELGLIKMGSHSTLNPTV